MQTINTQMKTLLENFKGFVRVFSLTNGTAVNNVRKGTSEKLSESTMDKIAATAGYEAITVFVPLDGSSSATLDCIEDANNAFINSITKTLTDDKELKDKEATERMEKARVKMEANKAAKDAKDAKETDEETTETVVEETPEVALDINAV